MESTFNYARDKAVDFDFRNTFWGMTRSDVKISERAYPTSENDTHITYNDTFMNLQATVGFHFVDDSLIEAGYAFHEYYSDPILYLREFTRFKLQLSHIYGEPLQQTDICSCSRENLSCIGECECAESKVYLVQWLTPRSIIRLILASDDMST